MTGHARCNQKKTSIDEPSLKTGVHLAKILTMIELFSSAEKPTYPIIYKKNPYIPSVFSARDERLNSRGTTLVSVQRASLFAPFTPDNGGAPIRFTDNGTENLRLR